MEDMGNTTTRRRPAGTRRSNSPTRRSSATATDQYAARHNPFVYFHSIIDGPDCDAARRPARPPPDGPAVRRRRRRTSRSSPPTCATTATTSRAPTAGRAATRRSTRSSRSGSRGSRTRRPTSRTARLIVDVRRVRVRRRAPAACRTSPNTPNAGGQTPGPGGGRIGAVVVSPFIDAGDDDRHAVQPLLVAAHDRGPLRPVAPGLRGALDGVRLRRLQRAARRRRRGALPVHEARPPRQPGRRNADRRRPALRPRRPGAHGPHGPRAVQRRRPPRLHARRPRLPDRHVPRTRRNARRPWSRRRSAAPASSERCASSWRPGPGTSNYSESRGPQMAVRTVAATWAGVPLISTSEKRCTVHPSASSAAVLAASCRRRQRVR